MKCSCPDINLTIRWLSHLPPLQHPHQLQLHQLHSIRRSTSHTFENSIRFSHIHIFTFPLHLCLFASNHMLAGLFNPFIRISVSECSTDAFVLCVCMFAFPTPCLTHTLRVGHRFVRVSRHRTPSYQWGVLGSHCTRRFGCIQTRRRETECLGFRDAMLRPSDGCVWW